MRVLQLDSGRAMGGGQWQVLRLLRGLRGAGLDSALLARAGSPLWERAHSEGFDAGALSPLRLGRLAARFDLVHAHDARSHSWAALLGLPLIVSRRVAFRVRNSALSRWKYARARHFIAVSEHAAGQLRDAGIAASKISVIYDGVPLFPRAAGAASEVVAAGKLPELALSSWPAARVAQNLDRDLNTAAVMLYLSHSEGLGSAVLLAMSRGVAVIASDLPAIREIIRHAVDGILVPNESSAIHAAVRQLLADHPFRQALAEAARATVERRFTEERMVAQTLRVYRELLRVD